MLVGMRNSCGCVRPGYRAEVKYSIEIEAKANTELQVSENKSKTSGEKVSFSSFQAIPGKKFIEWFTKGEMLGVSK